MSLTGEVMFKLMFQSERSFKVFLGRFCTHSTIPAAEGGGVFSEQLEGGEGVVWGHWVRLFHFHLVFKDT